MSSGEVFSLNRRVLLQSAKVQFLSFFFFAPPKIEKEILSYEDGKM